MAGAGLTLLESCSNSSTTVASMYPSQAIPSPLPLHRARPLEFDVFTMQQCSVLFYGGHHVFPVKGSIPSKSLGLGSKNGTRVLLAGAPLGLSDLSPKPITGLCGLKNGPAPPQAASPPPLIRGGRRSSAAKHEKVSLDGSKETQQQQHASSAREPNQKQSSGRLEARRAVMGVLERRDSPGILVRKQDAVFALDISKEGREVAWRWLMDKWDDIWTTYGSGYLLTSFIGSIVSPFASTEKVKEIGKFFANRTKAAIGRTLKQSIEQVQVNAKWAQSIEKDKDLANAVKKLAINKP
ncbi:hypothetical protein F3Y22_tig00111542pilonHSYRG00020 [Hibiscus syriacus]|uniref:ERAP1-like C-terminal domain-containing protein n=1 Tax=Hibiscus syriacus TaxID=106335 RepID=A0A6A2XMT4_HIBSY|nr:hypothetical protein F3Y22_tig00111542pilonHSYRG00020 [Hibiscus syriacus]